MTYKLLVKKLYLNRSNFIVASKLKEYCKEIKLNYASAISYLLSNRYIIRVLRGIFYLPSIEERKLKKLDINYFEAIAKALELKGIKNWYFGLETSLKLNNLTHEYFTTDYILNDTLFRPRPIEIMGHKIRFIKIKPSLLKFGVIKNKINFSENEKTLLDFIYLNRYNGAKEESIKSKISELKKNCSAKKIIKYSKKYNKAVARFIGCLYD